MDLIYGQQIECGKKYYFHHPVGEQANGATVTIPVLVMKSATPGPTLYINGAVHGAELNGSVAAWQVFRELSPEDFCGTLIVTPIANALGFQRRDKISDLDYQDLDAAFPGKANGTFTDRIAHTIWQEILKSKPDCVINFHTMGPFWYAIQYTVSKMLPFIAPEVTERTHELAMSFGAENNCYIDWQNSTGEWQGTSSALDIVCMKEGIPCFMAEMDGGGRIEEASLAVARRGIYNVMKKLGMMTGKLDRPAVQRVITKRTFLRCDNGGLIQMPFQPGTIHKQGELLAQIHYFDETPHEVLLSTDAVMIGVRMNPVVSTGDPIAFYGSEWHDEPTSEEA